MRVLLVHLAAWQALDAFTTWRALSSGLAGEGNGVVAWAIAEAGWLGLLATKALAWLACAAVAASLVRAGKPAWAAGGLRAVCLLMMAVVTVNSGVLLWISS